MLAAMPDRRSQTLERELLEFAPDAVVGVDEQGEIQLVNSLTEAVFGYSREELIGRSVEMLVPRGLSDDHVIHRDGYFESLRIPVACDDAGALRREARGYRQPNPGGRSGDHRDFSLKLLHRVPPS